MCSQCYWHAQTKGNRIAWSVVAGLLVLGITFWVPGMLGTRKCVDKFRNCDGLLHEQNATVITAKALACVRGYKQCISTPATIWALGWMFFAMSWIPCTYFCLCARPPHGLPHSSSSYRPSSSFAGRVPATNNGLGSQGGRPVGGGFGIQMGMPAYPGDAPRQPPSLQQFFSLGGSSTASSTAAAAAAAAARPVEFPPPNGVYPPARGAAAGGTVLGAAAPAIGVPAVGVPVQLPPAERSRGPPAAATAAPAAAAAAAAVGAGGLAPLRAARQGSLRASPHPLQASASLGSPQSLRRQPGSDQYPTSSDGPHSSDFMPSDEASSGQLPIVRR